MSTAGTGTEWQRQSKGGTPSVPWRERIEALKYVAPLLRLVWQTHRGYTSTIVALRLVRSFIPVAVLWIGRLIIDNIVALRSGAGGTTVGHLWWLITLELVIVVVGELLARASMMTEQLLADLFKDRVTVRLMQHAATLDLHRFEDPLFHDQLERARRQTENRIAIVTTLLGMAQNALTLATLGIALAAFNPGLLLLLVVAALPNFLGETHFASKQYAQLNRWTPERRRLDYLSYVGASEETAKELQIFGLSEWLVQRYRSLAALLYDEIRRLAVRRALVGTLFSLVASLGYYASYVVIIMRAVDGTISIGVLTFLAGSFKRGRELIEGLLSTVGDVSQQALYVRDLFGFFEVRPTIVSKPGAAPPPSRIQSGFTFEDVSFRYAGSERWALRNVNFAIRPGEHIGLVGENGAGKTTLIKLLSRLYDPTEGRILLDGIDLREYDLAKLRHAISVIFQDFVRYDLRFDENIGVGDIEIVGEELDRYTIKNALNVDTGGPGRNAKNEPFHPDIEDVPEQIRVAAERSLASSLLSQLPDRYRQMLGRRFNGGVKLSGGEWQKVALARAYMRDTQILILDEPTAALDARAEYEGLLRFSELMAGRMAIIISHHFSTVRIAHRVIVLKEGTVAESGSHDELVSRNGIYAGLFAMQAEAYR